MPSSSPPEGERELELQSTIEAMQEELESNLANGMEEAFPFDGVWVSESDDPALQWQVLVITSTYFYKVETQKPASSDIPEGVQEMFASIEAVDNDAQHIDLRIEGFRVNGRLVGFDFPIANVVYEVDGDVLKIGIARTGDGQYPPAPDDLAYYRK
jgi:hypothetical protein